ncbi:MAG TPA: cobalt-precorrin-5B (C(1))-methyltransferase [Anaeromyxobacteraceae bacterium]|nr:cobalt-precorrin-5B (C(1))-methyltransferase [Anaeromyxobacteraceae bacterium]
MTDGGLRTGFTTGACAAAAALAAARALREGRVPSAVELRLPNGTPARFAVARGELRAASASCAVVKDAGDDPDVTHGAEIVATVTLRDAPGVTVRGGPGVATVTKPGLGLEVGGPAITAIPRRHVGETVAAALAGTGRGADVELSVPRGEALARQTLNARLGLVGGISILGTTGLVRPFSAAAFGASVMRAVDVAAATAHRELILSTGARTEAAAMREHPALDETAFVQAGDCIGIGLSRAAHRGIPRVRLYAMVGKLAKVAAGMMQTHASRGEVDTRLLAALAQEAGATPERRAAIERATTARHALELAEGAKLDRFPAVLCARVAERCAEHVQRRLAIEVVMIGFDGEALARSEVTA